MVSRAIVSTSDAPLVIRVVPTRTRHFAGTTTYSRRRHGRQPPITMSQVVNSVLRRHPLLQGHRNVARADNLLKAFLSFYRRAVYKVLTSSFVPGHRLGN